MVTHRDKGRTVLCSRGLGELLQVRYSAGMRLAIVKLRTGGTTAESARGVRVYEEGCSDTSSKRKQ